jgi:gliding motility-associated-like protein
VNADVTQPAKLSVAETHTDASCPGVLDGSITLTITGGTPVTLTPPTYNIFWSDGLTTATRPAKDTIYSVIVTDLNGCAEPLDITVGFKDGARCVAANEIITPNGDGKNDTWVIRNIDFYPNAEVLIFNRWGKLIFRTKNPAANQWDGKFKGKPVPTDSYHYIIYLNDGSQPKTGVISVIR